MRFNLLLALLVLILSTSAVAATSAKGQAKSAPVPYLGPLPGDPAPMFKLNDVDGGLHRLTDYLNQGNVVVLEWLNPSCPFTQKFHDRADFAGKTADAFAGQPVMWLGIDSSAPGEDGSDTRDIRQFVRDYAITSPILLDSNGHVGRSYGVRNTPTMIVIAPNGEVIYRGAPDASGALDWEPAGKNYVKAAIEAALIGEMPKFTQTAAYGCSVKYTAPRLTASADSARF